MEDLSTEELGWVAKRMITEQKVMTRAEWIEYLREWRDEDCTCETTGHEDKDVSCRVYNANQDPNFKIEGEGVPKHQFWCPIAKHKEDVCRRAARITDIKSNGNALWSNKLCDTVASCKCEDGMGIRVWDADKDKVHPNILKSVEGSIGNDPFIGYQCQKWYKDDQAPWCVVGFDSTCGDRRSHKLNENGVTVYISSVPCTGELTRQVTAEAGQLCTVTRAIMLTLDALRYTFLLPMFYIVVVFLMTGCSGSMPSSISDLSRNFDVLDHEDLEFLSDDDLSSDDNGEEGEEEDVSASNAGSGDSSGSGQDNKKRKGAESDSSDLPGGVANDDDGSAEPTWQATQQGSGSGSDSTQEVDFSDSSEASAPKKKGKK